LSDRISFNSNGINGSLYDQLFVQGEFFAKVGFEYCFFN
jgi:hypothetical protein